MNKKLKVSQVILWSFFSVEIFAQVPPPPGNAPPGLALPGWMGLLVVALVYGAYKSLSNPQKR
jgi:hypothetical protein